MRVEIFSTVSEQIVAHARRDAPREACGLLLGRPGRIERALAAPNVAADPLAAFEIDPVLLLRCHREARGGGAAVLGWYHSHPGGAARPSAVDAAHALDDGKLWLVVAAGRIGAFVTAAAGDVAGRFSAVDLIVLPPGAHR